MELFYFLILALALIVLALLDLLGKLNLLRPLPLALVLLAGLNAPLWAALLSAGGLNRLPTWLYLLYYIALGGFLLYLLLRLHLWPLRDKQPVSLRLKIMIGGRLITRAALGGMVLEMIFLLLTFRRLPAALPPSLYWWNLLFAALMLFALFANGTLRIFFTSKRLSIVRRVVMLLTMWIPLVNLCVLLYACRLVYEEYDFAVHKENLRATRAHSDLCATKYPLVMVHGILFRDLKYFNYWGRIPRELMRYGATIYYGNQEAVGTIHTNAHDLKAKIDEVLAETGAEKVNLIAHSKGGLDSRYCISMLGMADKVASLTTINSPHYGCRFADKATRMPEKLYRFIAARVDNTFRKLGDKTPDFYTATKQFTTTASAAFNEEVQNMPQVYYQSYMSQMGSFRSHNILALTYLIIKPLDGANDGLVAVPSAKWGNFRTLFLPAGKRGISHGDMIDLMREDIKGFDVCETYVQIVRELKEMGY